MPTKRLTTYRPVKRALHLLCLLAVLLNTAGPAGGASPVPGTFIVNTAEVLYADANGNYFSLTSPAVQTEVAAGPQLQLSIKPSSDPVPQGSQLTYTITLNNSGNGTASTAVVVSSSLPAGTSFVSASNSGILANNIITWQLGNIPAGGSSTVSVLVLVGQATPSGTVLLLSAEAVSSEGARASATTAPLVGSGGALTITMAADSSLVTAGNNITYTVIAENTGPVTVNNISILAPLPGQTSFVSADSNGQFNNGVISWKAGELLPGQSASYTFIVRTFSSIADNTVLTNTASASGTNIPATQSNTVEVIIRNQAAITLTPNPAIIIANGKDSSVLTALCVDSAGNHLPDGTLVTFSTDKGTFSNGNTTIIVPISGNRGEARTLLTAPILAVPDTALVQASIGLLASNTVKLEVLPGAASVKVYDVANNRFITASDSRYSIEVVITYVDSNGVTQTQKATVDTNGLYVIPNIQANGGSYTIQTFIRDKNTGLVLITTPPQTINIVAGKLTTATQNSIYGAIRKKSDQTQVYQGITVYLYKLNGTPALDSSGNQISAVTDAGGKYAFPDVPPGDYYITAQVNGREIFLTTPSIHENSGVVLVDADLLVDPFGFAFDSITGDALPGVTVELWEQVAGVWGIADLSYLIGVPGAVTVNPLTTLADGTYQWPIVRPGAYRLVVTPAPGSDYTFPTTNPAPFFALDTGSLGETFNVVLVDVRVNLPLDPPPARLEVSKNANKNTAAIGDSIYYTVNISNSGLSAASGIQVIDSMPAGIQYVPGTTRIDNAAAADPVTSSDNTLTWTIPTLLNTGATQISYHALVGAGAKKGDARNTVYAQGSNAGRTITSNSASKTVKITEGIFTSRATIIGKVFIDVDADHLQRRAADSQRPAPAESEEPGLPGIVLYLEDGTRVITDKNGKFSIPGVAAGTHVLRLDESTLPAGLTLVPASNRAMDNPASQFVDLRAGLIHKANFTLLRIATGQLKETGNTLSPASSGSLKPEPDPVAVSPAGPETDGKIKEAPGLEEQILEMTPDLEILQPHDNATILRNSTNIIIKAPLDASADLSVNGQPVDKKRIGREVSNKKTQVIIQEYIAVDLEPGSANRISVSLTDPFGNPRGSREITVITAGAPAKISLAPAQKTLPADGSSTTVVTVSVLDRLGLVLTYPDSVTITASAGTILTPDFDQGKAGLQIPCRDGLAEFIVQAPRETGEAEIQAYFDTLDAATTINFVPHLRSLMITGIGEVAVGRESDKKAAAFVKGDIGHGVLLTAAYDSAKEDDAELFRTSDSYLEEEAKYPTYGDESQVGYEAQSRDKLFLKLEKDKSFLMYGDYHTDLDQTRLNAYNRTFNGFKADIDLDRFTLRSFVSHTDQTQVVDTLPGRGISGYYTLTSTPAIEGSERVTIETRDRRSPEHVISRESMTRYADYDIDYASGTLLFKTPIPGYDADNNPVFVIVSYESSGGDDKYYIYGSRGSYRINDRLKLGMTGVVEENAVDNAHLLGMDLTLNLPGETTIRGELADTSSVFDINSIYTSKSGQGWSIEVDSRPLANINVSTYYRQTSDWFGNPSAVDAGRGLEKYGTGLNYQLTPSTSMQVSYDKENDTLNSMDNSRAAAGVVKKFSKTTVTAEISHEEANDSFIPAASSTARSPFDISEETPGNLTAFKLGLDTRLRPDLSLVLSHKQDIIHNRQNQSRVKLSYQLNELNRLYIAEEYSSYQDRDENRIQIGGETKVIKNTVAFNEYRLDNGSDGSRTQQVIGLRNKFMLADDITGDLSFENQKTLSGSERSDRADALAITGGIEYLPEENTKLTSRLEYRAETSDSSGRSWLAELGIVHQLNSDYSLLFKERYFIDAPDGLGSHATSRAMTGLAYRPIAHDRFNALAKLEWKYDDGPTGSAFRNNSYIFSTEGVYQLNSQTQLIAKYAGKYLDEEDMFNSYTDLLAARVLYDISRRFDIGAEYRLLTSHATASSSQGGSLELGYRILEDFWVSLGYSFDAFDADLTNDYNDEGVYLRFRFKFDEKSLTKNLKTIRSLKEKTGDNP